MSSRWARARRVASLVLPLAVFTVAQIRAQAPQSRGGSTELSAMPHVILAFERIGFPIPRYTLDIDARGQGAYVGEQATPVVRGMATEPATQPFDRSFAISAATADRIFALAQQLDYFNIPCASRAKNLADIGAKTLRYTGPNGAGSCTFTYSDNKTVSELNELLHGITETMDTGRELDRLHRYDRLGLDDAMEALKEEASDGRALELGTIAASLRSIAADPDVMQRVRVRAAALLSAVPPDAATH